MSDTVSASASASASSAQPVVDLALLKSNDKSAVSIFNNKPAGAASSNNPRGSFLGATLYNFFLGNKPTAKAEPVQEAMPTLSDKHVLTLSDDDNDEGFSHVGYRQLSYAEVASMAKALYPKTNDKQSRTVSVPVDAVYPESLASSMLSTDEDYEDEGTASLVASGALVEGASAPAVHAEYLDGDRAENIIRKNINNKRHLFDGEHYKGWGAQNKWSRG